MRAAAGLVIGFVLAVGLNAYSYFNSDKIALRSMAARPVSEAEQPAMYRIVRELATSARQPMPRLYVSPTAQPNAFATGRNPRHAAVCATAGILQILDERELRAVLGHELSHVYNRDILISSVAGAFGAGITLLANFAHLLRRRRPRPQPLRRAADGLPRPAGGLADPALDQPRPRVPGRRSRAPSCTNDPLALASALRKLERGTNAVSLVKTPRLQTASHMMIANPFGSTARSLFSTHPPMEQRIQRLEQMAQQRPPLPALTRRLRRRRTRRRPRRRPGRRRRP